MSARFCAQIFVHILREVNPAPSHLYADKSWRLLETDVRFASFGGCSPQVQVVRCDKILEKASVIHR